MAGVGRQLRDGWLAIAVCFGEIQTLLIVCVAYLLVLGPVAVGAAAARRDLLAKRGFGDAQSAWSPADTIASPDLERARRLF